MSIANYPVGHLFIIIREPALRICDENHCAAALVEIFDRWHENRLKNRKMKSRINQVEDLVQWHSYDSLSKEMFGLYGRTKIIDSIALLESKGFISKTANSDPKYSRDRTSNYFYHPETVTNALNRLNKADYRTIFEKTDLPPVIQNAGMESVLTGFGGEINLPGGDYVQKQTVQHPKTDDATSENGRSLKDPLIKISSTNLKISNADARKKSADAESLISEQPEASPPISPLEGTTNKLDEAIHQQTRAEGKQAILEGNQNTNTPSLESNLDPSGEKDCPAPRVTKSDKSKTLFGKPTLLAQQKERARKASDAAIVKAGVQNIRWSDRAGYERFEAYVVEHIRQVNLGLKKDFEPIANPDTYLRGVLTKTANCADENSADLAIWKNWNLEPVSPNYIEFKPSKQPIEVERDQTTGNTGYPRIDNIKGISKESRLLMVEMRLKSEALKAEKEAKKRLAMEVWNES
jgi:hypothetical protein